MHLYIIYKYFQYGYVHGDTPIASLAPASSRINCPTAKIRVEAGLCSKKIALASTCSHNMWLWPSARSQRSSQTWPSTPLTAKFSSTSPLAHTHTHRHAHEQLHSSNTGHRQNRKTNPRRPCFTLEGSQFGRFGKCQQTTKKRGLWHRPLRRLFDRHRVYHGGQTWLSYLFGKERGMMFGGYRQCDQYHPVIFEFG